MGHIIVDFPDQYRKDTTTRKPFTEEEDLKKIELVNKIFFYILFTYYLHIIYILFTHLKIISFVRII